MPETKLEKLQNEYRLSDVENDKIFNSLIVPEFYSAMSKSDNPIVTIVAGQTASGKSTLIKD